MAEKKTEKYELKEVPTNYGLAIVDDEGNTMTLDQAIVLLLNKVSKLEEILGK